MVYVARRQHRMLVPLGVPIYVVPRGADDRGNARHNIGHLPDFLMVMTIVGIEPAATI